MSKSTRIIATALFIFQITLFSAQKPYKVPQNRIALAAEYAEKYNKEGEDENEFVILNDEIIYTFEHTKKDYTTDDFYTRAIKTQHTAFLTLIEKKRGYLVDNFDDESSLMKKRFIVNGKSSSRNYIGRDCISNYSESILSSDNRLCSFGFYSEEVGDVSELQIVKTFKNVRYLTSVYFRTNKPIITKRIVFKVPNWLEVEFHEINFDGFDIVKNVEEVTGKNQYTEYSWVIKNLDKSPEGAFMPGGTYFEPHIAINIKSIKKKDDKLELFRDNAAVYSWYQELVSNCDNESIELVRFVNNLMKDKTDDEEKIKAIYYWIQDNVRYIAYEDGIMGFKPDDAKDVFAMKYGDCKGVANLAKTMLTEAGFDARLTWVGTNRLGPKYDYSFPSLANDNHMICTVIKDDEQIFIDPTETYIKLRDNADRIQGRNVMIEDGDNFIISSVPEADYKRNLVRKNWTMDIVGDLVKGRVSREYNGNRKVSIMNSYSYTAAHEKEESLKSFLENHDKNVKVTNYTSKGLENRDEPILFEFDIEQENAILNVNDDLYISLEMDRNFSEADVDLPRTVDIYFGDKVYNVLDVTLNIPQGYSLDYMPEAIHIEKEEYKINASYTNEGNQVKYHREIIIPNRSIKKEHAKEWNESLEQLNELYDDQIVLKKN